ncbi:hypothetical protein QIS74_04267 [Colletotrichum tabaci]|uniref:Uncharacterized protein n=1 Tax=Colletotrichum tabaci TaxID=1209068 RepID=A0AAV9TK56_9PEZI
MKRKRNGEDSAEACPSPRRRVKEGPFQESKSVRERARPYLLAVGKMHVDVLETMWSVGRNRRVEPGHVQELKDTFMRGGLERSAPENRIAVLCSAEEVRRIRQRIGQGGDGDGDGDGDPSDGEASFLHWAGVNNSKAEVMAGQHRLCALREYVKATGAPESDAWWTCELYDKDRLPAELNIKLRINRRDPSLPDNHGQIWTQLVSIASDAAEPTTRNQATVDHKLVEALRLGSEKSFPTRRLVTLWNHKRWRTLTTRWCQTRLGLETFNISTFEWMASLRIDDYWFATLEAALETLQALPLDETQDLGQDDWNRLAAALQGSSSTGDGAADVKRRTQEAVEAVFYTGDGSNRPHRRAAGLLETLDDAAYRRVCRATWTLPDLAFVDLKRFLRSKRPEMETAVRVLHHVIVGTFFFIALTDLFARVLRRWWSWRPRQPLPAAAAVPGTGRDEDDADLVRYRNKDAAVLQGAYLSVGLVQAVSHLAALLYAHRHPALSVRDFFFGFPSPWTDWSSLGRSAWVSNVLQYDLVLYVAGAVVHNLHAVWKLRASGYVAGRECVAAAVCVVLGQFCLGSGATWAALWYWREGVLTSLSTIQ